MTSTVPPPPRFDRELGRCDRGAPLALRCLDAPKPQPDLEVPAHRLAKKDVFLKDVCDAARLHCRRAADADAARPKTLQPGDDSKQRGLAGSVWPQDRGRASCGEGERGYVQDDPALPLDTHALDRDAGHGRERC